jgi:hypothetical protein
MNGNASAAAYGWFAVFYIVYIASGALPSESRPGRRDPGRVVIDRLIFFAAIFALPFFALPRGFGVDPAALYLGAGKPLDWLALTLALSALGFAVGFFSRKSEADLASYPQYLPKRWTVGAWGLELGSWGLYLVAYEFAFRGYLLAALMPLGAATAIAATTALYAIAHLPKSAKEAIGALPFGIVASLLAVRFGTFLPAVAIHIALAVGNDIGAMRASRRAATVRA